MSVSSETREFHRRVLRTLVDGAPGSSTTEIHALYDAVAPLVYEGALASPVASHCHRRNLLDSLEEEGLVAGFDRPRARGRTWVPVSDTRATDEEADEKTGEHELT
jgi:hypothetical protein